MNASPGVCAGQLNAQFTRRCAVEFGVWLSCVSELGNFFFLLLVVGQVCCGIARTAISEHCAKCRNGNEVDSFTSVCAWSGISPAHPKQSHMMMLSSVLSMTVAAFVSDALATTSNIHLATSRSVLAVPSDVSVDPKPEVEHWIGQILIPNPSCAQITFVFTLMKSGESWTGRFSMSPGCGVSGMFDVAMEELTRNDTTIHFVVPPPPARNTYELTLDTSGKAGNGRLLIGGMQPVYIRAARASEAEAANVAPKRPQMPSLPLPYEQRPCIVPSKGPSGSLAGVLNLPKNADGSSGMMPAVVLIPDEDAVDLDHAEGTHKFGLVLADLLARQGIAVLRYASPGVGGSGGTYLDSSLGDAAMDAAGAVAFLKGVPGVDPKRVGLIGRGEGAMVSARAAAESPDVAFAVLMAPTAVNGQQVLLARERVQLRAQGEDPTYLAARLERFAKVLAAAAKKDDAALTSALEDDFQAQMKVGRAMGMLNPFQQRDLIQVQADYYRTPRVVSRLNEEPRPYLEKLRVPVLLLAGEMDLISPTGELLPGVQTALKTAGNGGVTTRTLPKTNHWFQPCATGFPDEREQIQTTVSPEAVGAIVEWLKGVAKP